MKKSFLISTLLLLFQFFAFAQEVQWACRVTETNDKAAEIWDTRGALGVPNVYPRLKIGNSWSIGSISEGKEMDGEVFVKLNFCKSVPAKQLVIVENFNPGSVKAVYLYDIKNTERQVYQAEPGADTSKHRILSIKFDAMESNISYVKIVAEPSKVPGANCIDAVGISSSQEPIKLEINVHKDPKFLPTVQFIGGTINTKYEEYSPVISPDGNTLYFARMGDPENIGGDQGDIDIWYSTKDENGRWTLAKNIGEPLNNTDHNFVASVAADGDALLIGNTYGSNGKSKGEGCALTHRTRNGWALPKNLNLKNFYNNHEHVSFFIANNEKVLLMTIEDQNQSFGEQDIYVCFMKPDGTWSSPQNIGSGINTVNSETNLFLSPDMTTLYFSSNGYTGYGGYDIYMSKRLDDTWQSWSKPVNLGPIVNSEEDEFCFVITDDGKFAYGYKYFNEQQQHDIYVIGLPGDAKLVKNEPVLKLTGKIMHADNQAPIASTINYTNEATGKDAGGTTSDSITGNFTIILPKGVNYGLTVNAPGFMPVSENINASKDLEYSELKKDILMVPIEVGKMVKLKNVFFTRGTADLTETSFPELNGIQQFLQSNPSVSIQLEGHTDNQGDPKGNIKLSEQRVEVVKDYLVTNGISAKRIELKAFGGTKPVASNTHEETRKLNRRVEFIIIKK